MDEQLYRRSMGYSFDVDRVGREASNGIGSASDAVEVSAFSLEDGSDLFIGDIEYATKTDELLNSELGALAYACEVASSYDDEARRTLELVATFMEGLQELRETGIAFNGNTQEELDALVESMQRANPNADVEELMNLVFEMVDYVSELAVDAKRPATL